MFSEHKHPNPSINMWSLPTNTRAPTNTIPISNSDLSYTQNISDMDEVSFPSLTENSSTTTQQYNFDRFRNANTEISSSSERSSSWTPLRFCLLYINIVLLIYSIIVPIAGTIIGVSMKFVDANGAAFFVWAGSSAFSLPTSVFGAISYGKNKNSLKVCAWFIVGITCSLIVHLAASLVYAATNKQFENEEEDGTFTALILIMSVVSVYAISVSMSCIWYRKQRTSNYSEIES
ncbi:Tenm1 [Acrasis kona]|uniref:Tenm1 n=1 Tax=Acrasis kona TaxID=1008807 RepID=A0AAW2YRW6_9EUKA